MFKSIEYSSIIILIVITFPSELYAEYQDANDGSQYANQNHAERSFEQFIKTLRCISDE
jgi:hypothetical protein